MVAAAAFCARPSRRPWNQGLPLVHFSARVSTLVRNCTSRVVSESFDDKAKKAQIELRSGRGQGHTWNVLKPAWMAAAAAAASSGCPATATARFSVELVITFIASAEGPVGV